MAAFAMLAELIKKPQTPGNAGGLRYTKIGRRLRARTNSLMSEH